MDTEQARASLQELARETIGIVERIEQGVMPSGADRIRLRDLLLAARSQLPDAGYPAEAAWRGIQRASIGAETALDHTDPGFWREVREELEAGVGTLESILRTSRPREQDFRIVG